MNDIHIFFGWFLKKIIETISNGLIESTIYYYLNIIYMDSITY